MKTFFELSRKDKKMADKRKKDQEIHSDEDVKKQSEREEFNPDELEEENSDEFMDDDES
jgi:hypothetical protein